VIAGLVAMRKKIAVIGAFDRYNYGDLLFPIVIEHYVDSMKKDCHLDFFGLRKSRMTRFGGKDTESVRQILGVKGQQYDALFVAGGAVAGVAWDSMLLSLCRSRISYKAFKTFVRVLKKSRNEFSRIWLRGKTHFPWIFTRESVGYDCKVIYNAVGSVDRGIEDFDLLRSQLAQADCLSLRDKQSFENFADLGVQLSPDSAAVLPDRFTISYL